MIKKKISTLLVFIVIVILTNIIMLPCQFLGLGSKSTQLVKSIGKNIISCIYTYGYESKIKINGYSFSEEDLRLDLFIAHYDASEKIQEIKLNKVQELIETAKNFYFQSTKKL